MAKRMKLFFTTKCVLFSGWHSVKKIFKMYIKNFFAHFKLPLCLQIGKVMCELWMIKGKKSRE